MAAKRRKGDLAGEVLALPDGRRLGYAEYGDPDGLPVLAFHGTPGSRFMFRLADAPARALGLRILAPERPGFGLSSPQPGRTLADWARDMAHFADAFGLERFAVAGVSGGGPYAAACAALLPERVLSAALVSPVGPVCGPDCAASIGAAHHAIFRMLPKAPQLCRGAFGFGRLGFLHAPLALYALIMSRACPQDWRILSRREVRLSLLQGVAEGVRRGSQGAVEEMRLFSRPWNVPLDDIRAPCFLWQGDADRNVPPAAAFRLGELIPGCRATRIEGAGHYWIFDHLELVLRSLKDAAGPASSAASAGRGRLYRQRRGAGKA